MAQVVWVTSNYKRWLQPSSMGRQGENLVGRKAVTSLEGHKFGIYLRQNTLDKMDFSVGLRWIRSSGDVPLVRCNGWHAEHRNQLDKKSPNYKVSENTCHVHRATERYFAAQGLKKLGFAFATDEFHDLASALTYIIDKYGFINKKTKEPFFDFPLFRKRT